MWKIFKKKESELNSLIDADLRAELGKYRQFDILNTEKTDAAIFVDNKVVKV
jgi:hypothetical protein